MKFEPSKLTYQPSMATRNNRGLQEANPNGRNGHQDGQNLNNMLHRARNKMRKTLLCPDHV